LQLTLSPTSKTIPTIPSNHKKVTQHPRSTLQPTKSKKESPFGDPDNIKATLSSYLKTVNEQREIVKAQQVLANQQQLSSNSQSNILNIQFQKQFSVNT